MVQQFTFQDIIFLTLYGGVTLISLIVCCYLLLRRANAISPEVASPVRVRRWVAVFLATMAASHVWWLISFPGYPIDIYSELAIVCMGLDIMTILPALLCTMLVMLQDRDRPLWPVGVIVALALTDLSIINAAGTDASTVHIVLSSFIILCISITMVRSVRQYRRWLCDNYADMEHKEVWQSLIVLAAFILSSVTYFVFSKGIFWEIVTQLTDIVLIFIMLWRVETLQTLEEPATEPQEAMAAPDSVQNKIDILLQKYCVDARLYLQQDVSATQLARLIGTNRTYLSQYFAQHGMTYNTYINSLRIEYFIRLYLEAVAGHRIFTARQLARESGYRSYSTFSAAFKQIKGETATEWMHNNTKQALPPSTKENSTK